MLFQLFISADFFHWKVEPCTLTVRWGLKANKLPSSFLCMSSRNWNWALIFSNMVLHYGSTRKCTLRDTQTLCNLQHGYAQTFTRKCLFILFTLFLEKKMILTEMRWYIKHFYLGVSVFCSGNVISCNFICFPGKITLNIKWEFFRAML